MSQNKLIEIGSKANVILRFKKTTEVNGICYEANEPYLLFKNANVLVEYSNDNKTASASRTIIADSQITPRTISIGSINLTRKLIALLTTFEAAEESFALTKFQTSEVEDADGTKQIMLNEDILPDTEDQIFVYEEDTFDKIEFTFSAAPDRVISTDFDLSKNYIVSYQSELEGLKFELVKQHVPYLSLEIQGVGNVDKVKKNISMYFDKVSLNTSIDFTFIQDQMINVPLSFNVIENKNNYVWVEN